MAIDYKELQNTIINMVTGLDCTAEEKTALFMAVSSTTDVMELQKISAQVNEEKARLNEDSSSKIFDEINDHLAIVRMGGKEEYLIKTTSEWIESGLLFDTWRDAHAAKKYLESKHVITDITVMVEGKKKVIDLFDKWRGSPRAERYSGMSYLPNGKQGVGHMYNLWAPTDLVAKKGDKHLKLLDFMKEGLCKNNAANYEYLIQWVAHMVQKPQIVAGTAVAISGMQGTGKGTFTTVMQKLVGAYNYASGVSNKDLTGSFNSKIQNKMCIVIDEATFSGDRQQQGFMKGLVTEGVIRAELKGRDAKTITNYGRVIITTNNIKWGHLDTDDRRWLILEPNEKFKEANEYFRAIAHDLYEEEGINHFLNYLIEMDISAFDTYALPARVYGANTMLESLSQHESGKYFFYELADFGAKSSGSLTVECGTEVTFTELYQVYRETIMPYANSESQKAISALMKNAGFYNPIGTNSRKVRLPSQADLRDIMKTKYFSKWELDWTELEVKPTGKIIDMKPRVSILG